MSYFEPTSSERRGLVVLGVALLLILVVGVTGYIYRDDATGEGGRGMSGDSGLSRKEKERSSRYFAVPERKVETFPFDPNEADSTTLLRLGFAPFQVRGIYKYRALGGRYHEPEDVQRIPGMTNELWERIAPYIHIGHKYQYVQPVPRSHGRQMEPVADEALRYNRDTVRYPIKLRKGEQISVNEADTSQLKKIPGIGSYYARRIVRYRIDLGGFASADQLLEADEGIPAEVLDYVQIDPSAVRPIAVNQATKSQLVRHPYIRAYRANDIWQYRHNFGPLHSLDDLRQFPNFTEADIQRLRPYLTFE